MSFIDIKDPKKRDEIVADYLATVRRVQQRNEDEKALGLVRQAELEKTFNPIVKATEKSTEAITKALHVKQRTLPAIRRKRTWTEQQSDAIDFYLNDNKKKLDKYYGIQRDGEGKLWMGNGEVTLDGNNIIVDNVRYEGTPGLWSLIMTGVPTLNSYNNNDIELYTKLAKQTNVMNNPRNVGTGLPSRTKKHQILEELTKEEEEPGDVAGTGIFLPGDIKGLETKLALLLAEFRAGNTSTRNEIVIILDELQRRKRISRKEYKEINTYLTTTTTTTAL